MLIILAIDALEYEKVEEFKCNNLKQEFYGKTNIKEFSQPRTMVLWSSFITGKNKESEVLQDGNKEMWNKTWPINQTFFSKFKNPLILDLPGFSYNLKAHEKSRKLLKEFFTTKDKEIQDKIKQEYIYEAFQHHKQIKQQFQEALTKDHDLILAYFSIIDVIGHLDFGNTAQMQALYKEIDELAKNLKQHSLIILSDHGMKPIGIFGDHSEYGFWSTNFKDLKTPKITDFFNLISDLFKQ